MTWFTLALLPSAVVAVLLPPLLVVFACLAAATQWAFARLLAAAACFLSWTRS